MHTHTHLIITSPLHHRPQNTHQHLESQRPWDPVPCGSLGGLLPPSLEYQLQQGELMWPCSMSSHSFLNLPYREWEVLDAHLLGDVRFCPQQGWSCSSDPILGGAVFHNHWTPSFSVLTMWALPCLPPPPLPHITPITVPCDVAV